MLNTVGIAPTGTTTTRRTSGPATTACELAEDHVTGGVLGSAGGRATPCVIAPAVVAAAGAAERSVRERMS